MAELLSDQTWRQLEPGAGRLSRRELWRAVLVVLLGVLVAVVVTAGFRSGLVVPRLDLAGGHGYGYDEDTWVMYHGFELVNNGRFPVEVVGVGRDGPGLVFADPPHWEDWETGGRLRPGETMWVGVAYQVTDCEAVPGGSWPVPVRIARPWGTQTVWLEMPTQDRGSFHLPPGASGQPWDAKVEWQRNLADAVCHYRAGGEPWPDDDLAE